MAAVHEDLATVARVFLLALGQLNEDTTALVIEWPSGVQEVAACTGDPQVFVAMFEAQGGKVSVFQDLAVAS